MTTSSLGSGGYVVVQAWMVNDLGLKGAELMAYAVVYGFSQDGEQWFTGSASYVAEWAGCTRRRALELLKSLTERGLLEKRVREVNGVRFCDYKASPPVKKVHQGDEETSPGVVKKVHGGGEKSSPHKLEDKLEDKLEREAEASPRATSEAAVEAMNADERDAFAVADPQPEPEKPRKRTRFMPPSLEEVAEYVQSKGYRFDPEAFWSFYESVGWKVGSKPMKSWQAACVTWQKRQNPANIRRQGVSVDASIYDRTTRVI